MKKGKFAAVMIIASVIVLSITANAVAQERGQRRLSLLGCVGGSFARGDYPSEYDASSDFSFLPGLRLRFDDIVRSVPDSYLMFDVGFLKTGFNGYVAATDSTFYNGYEYITFNAMFGTASEALYYGGGLYLAPGLDAYSYRGYTDEWIGLDANGDFGLVGEIGTDLPRVVSVGVQGRFGLKSIGSKVDIKNTVILLTLAFHLSRF